MSLDGDTTEAHGASGKALDNLSGWFDLIDADGVGLVVVDLELTAKGATLRRLRLEFGELLVGIPAVLVRRLLQAGYCAKIKVNSPIKFDTCSMCMLCIYINASTSRSLKQASTCQCIFLRIETF